MNENEEQIIIKIPEEMRGASAGSFPLSPGTMSGHWDVGYLYYSFRQDLLKTRTVQEVFGVDKPEPPPIVIPKGHTTLTSPEGLNLRVWERFLDIAFRERPNVDSLEKVRSLIKSNASTDNFRFEDRLKGQKSQIATGGGTPPSLLRAFVFENRLPPNFQSEFFTWLLLQMSSEIQVAIQNNFKDPWSADLKALIAKWNKHFPKQSFINIEALQQNPPEKSNTLPNIPLLPKRSNQ